MRRRLVWLASAPRGAGCPAGHGARAEDDNAPSTNPATERPGIGLNRWQEDWSVLADPALRTEPLDDLKYIPLSSGDPNSYASLGVNLRERVESTQKGPFGIGPFGIGNPRTDTYLIQRLELHAD